MTSLCDLLAYKCNGKRTENIAVDQPKVVASYGAIFGFLSDERAVHQISVSICQAFHVRKLLYVVGKKSI